jgi:hypothetical protein
MLNDSLAELIGIMELLAGEYTATEEVGPFSEVLVIEDPPLLIVSTVIALNTTSITTEATIMVFEDSDIWCRQSPGHIKTLLVIY